MRKRIIFSVMALFLAFGVVFGQDIKDFISRYHAGGANSYVFFPGKRDLIPVMVNYDVFATEATDPFLVYGGISENVTTGASAAGNTNLQVRTLNGVASNDWVLVKLPAVNAKGTTAWNLRQCNGVLSTTNIMLSSALDWQAAAGATVYEVELLYQPEFGASTNKASAAGFVLAGNKGFPMVGHLTTDSNGVMSASVQYWK